MKYTIIKVSKDDRLELNLGRASVMYWFFAYPEVKTTLSELAKELGISKKTASKVVAKLMQEGFLSVEEIGRAWRIHCNIEHHYNTTLKIGYNVSNIYSSGIIKKIYEIVGNPKAIILFGSYRKGDDIGSSDLDIAVEVAGNSEFEIKNIGRIARLGFRRNVPVNLHVFSRNKVDLNLFSNIANGIVLEGFLEVKP